MFLFPQNVVSISQRLSKAKRSPSPKGACNFADSKIPSLAGWFAIWVLQRRECPNLGHIILPAGNMEEVWTVFSYFYIFGSLGLHQLPDEQFPPKKHRKSCKDTEKNKKTLQRKKSITPLTC